MSRFFNILIPGIFLPTCLGTVYNFSQYSSEIQYLFGIDKFRCDIGFILIIFFLGMCASIFGKQVDLNPKKMSIVSTILFTIGMFTMFISTNIKFLPLYYIACSFMGAGTGIGYVCPIKQLLSNFKDHKGLASGLAITGFGLGKFIAAPIVEYLLSKVTLPYMFLILSMIFLFIMGTCSFIFKPNPEYINTISTATPILKLKNSVFLTKQYFSVWIMFCINISCGLAIISQEKELLLNFKFKNITIIMILTAIFNILGRFIMSTISDKIGRKQTYRCICLLGVIASLLCFTQNKFQSLIGILLIEYVYGGNFSCLPSLLSNQFGIKSVSIIHAMTLSGWAIAGIIGPVLSNLININFLYIYLCLLYFLGFVLMEMFVKNK